MSEGRKRLLIVFAGVVVFVLGIGLYYLNYQKKQEQEFVARLTIKKPEEIPLGMPQQAFYDYDVTEHKAMFVIVGMNATSQTMQLKFMYPFKLQGNEITSKVTCSVDNTKLFHGKENKLVNAQTVVYQVTQVVLEKTIMQAICADKYCRTIRSYCELWL